MFKREDCEKIREKEEQKQKMENSSVLDPWRHRPHGISGGGDCAGLLSESFSAVSAASVRSPESMSSFQPPRRDPPGGRIARKRKSRACKRSATTYIAASPAHFRELVQRVTGNRSAEEMNQPPPPAAASAGSRALPALDLLSAYDRAGLFQPAAFGSDPAHAEFDPLLLAASGFPALDSWEVM